MDNLSQQVDEIEALTSIYENNFFIENEENSYSMEITPTVKLFVKLNNDYPSSAPPSYDLLAPELSSEEKQKIQLEFNNIFQENMGSPILFQWFEKLKEISLSSEKKHKNKIKTIENDFQKISVELPSAPLVKFNKTVFHGPTIEDRKSVFQGHACVIETEGDVKHFLNHLKENKKISQATHNMLAYRVNKNGSLLQDCDDDGENHAGRRLLHLLQILDLNNVAVVVSRWYGGIQLGPDRFKHITNAARKALVEAALVK